MTIQDLGPRHLQAANEIIRICTENDGISREEISSMLEDYGHEFHSSLPLLLEYGHVEEHETGFLASDIRTTDLYREILYSHAEKIPAFRGALLSIGPRGENREIMGNYYQMLNESSLLDFENLEALRWWSSIRETDRIPGTGGDDDIGLMGEMLSYESEKERLEETEKVVWTSRWYGDRFGYDIESFHDKSLEGQKYIEVKSSSQSFDTARMHLTHNEFRKLCQYGGDYFLHLWSEVSENHGIGPIEVEGAMVRRALNEIDPEIVSWDGSVIIPFVALMNN